MTSTIRLNVAYLGTDYAGWQIQPNAMTVQQRLQEALAEVCGQPVRATGAGRTDAGVHADGQVVHLGFDEACDEFDGGSLPTSAWVRGTNRHLPASIRVLCGSRLRGGFDARRDATNKRYRYRWWVGERILSPHEALRRVRLAPGVDLERAAELATRWVGRHDFAAFAKSGGSHTTTVRTIRRCELERHDENRVDLVVEGPGFLRGMVRALAGTLQETARGRISEERFDSLLRGGPRADAGPNAAAAGLTLEAVWYPPAVVLDRHP